MISLVFESLMKGTHSFKLLISDSELSSKKTPKSTEFSSYQIQLFSTISVTMSPFLIFLGLLVSLQLLSFLSQLLRLTYHSLRMIISFQFSLQMQLTCLIPNKIDLLEILSIWIENFPPFFITFLLKNPSAFGSKEVMIYPSCSSLRDFDLNGLMQ